MRDESNPAGKQECVINSNEGQCNSAEIHELDTKQEPGKPLTQYALAAAVIEENHIIHIPKMSAFLVSGTKDDKYAITLFPKENCQCPATGHWYHILVAKMSIGKPIEEKTYG